MKKSPAEEVNQAQKWFNYLQIPREATYSDVMMFKKIFEESLAERSERLEAERKVIEAVRDYCAVRVCCHWPPYDQEEHKKSCMHPMVNALARLDSLGGGK